MEYRRTKHPGKKATAKPTYDDKVKDSVLCGVQIQSKAGISWAARDGVWWGMTSDLKSINFVCDAIENAGQNKMRAHSLIQTHARNCVPAHIRFVIVANHNFLRLKAKPKQHKKQHKQRKPKSKKIVANES